MVLKPTPERWATRLHGLKDELWRKRHNREVTEVIDGLIHFGEVPPAKPAVGLWYGNGKPTMTAAAGSVYVEAGGKLWLHDGNNWIRRKTP